MIRCWGFFVILGTSIFGLAATVCGSRHQALARWYVWVHSQVLSTYTKAFEQLISTDSGSRGHFTRPINLRFFDVWCENERSFCRKVMETHDPNGPPPKQILLSILPIVGTFKTLPCLDSVYSMLTKHWKPSSRNSSNPSRLLTWSADLQAVPYVCGLKGMDRRPQT